MHLTSEFVMYGKYSPSSLISEAELWAYIASI